MARRFVRARPPKNHRPLFQVIKDHFFPHKGNDHHPHILRHRHLMGLSAFLIAFKGAAIFVPLAVADVTHANEVFTPVTPSNIIEQSNQARRNQDLSILVPDERLMEAAQAKADDMANRGYFSHTSPDGKTAMDRIRATGYPVSSAAENLAVHFFTAEDIERSWIQSPSHRSVLFDERYENTGAGVASGVFEEQETTFVVQLFGKKLDPTTTKPSQPLVTNSVVGSVNTLSDENPVGRVLAQTFSREQIDPIAREFYLYIIACLTAVLVLMLSIRFRARHAASVSHTMLVIGLSFILMLA